MKALLIFIFKDLPVIFRLHLLPSLPQLQVIDDIEAIILLVSGVYSSMLLFSHVIFQGGFVPECFLTVQTLHVLQFPLECVEELVAVDDVVRQADAERVFFSHVIQQ